MIWWWWTPLLFSFLFKDFIFLFSDRREGKEKERKKQQCVVVSRVFPTGDLAHNLGMCPDWGSNQQPFGSQAGAQSTEPHQPGPISYTILNIPCLFYAYQFCFLIPVPFSPLFPPFSSQLITLQMISVYDSIPVLVVWLVCFFRFNCW